MAAGDQADQAGTAAGPATSEAQETAATDGSGSASGEETVTSEDRSETISHSDSATAQS